MYVLSDELDFGRELESDFATFADEIAAHGPRLFVPWVEPSAYQGAWDIIALRATGDVNRDGLHPEEVARSRAALPSFAAWTDRHPRLIQAGFNRFGPGTHAFPHVDIAEPDAWRMFFPFHTAPGSGMRFSAGSQQVDQPWVPGRGFGFDSRVIRHESFHPAGGDARVILVADFHPRPEELVLALERSSCEQARQAVLRPAPWNPEGDRPELEPAR